MPAQLGDWGELVDFAWMIHLRLIRVRLVDPTWQMSSILFFAAHFRRVLLFR
jgi:hypothetical protein